MTRFRRPKTTIGRTQYQLRMPFPTVLTPENTMANFREILRWANELPHANDDSFVPYFIEYDPPEPAEEWDANLVTLLQSKFTTDLMPTGLWLVQASLSPTEVPAGAVGVDATLNVEGLNFGTAGNGVYSSIGYMDGEAVRYLDDFTIDFTAETFEPTYKWFLPPVDGGLMIPKVSWMNILRVNAADDDLTITGTARAATLTDPTVDGAIEVAPIPSYLYVWALRLSDGYNVPTALEDVTPD